MTNIFRRLSGLGFVHMPIKRKLTIIFVLSVMVPLFLSSLLFYNRSVAILTEKEQNDAGQTLKLAASNVEIKLRSYEKIYDAFYQEEGFFQSPAVGGRYTDLQLLEMNNGLQSLLVGNPNAVSAYLFFPNGQYAFYSLYDAAPFVSAYKADPAWVDEIRVKKGDVSWTISRTKDDGSGDRSSSVLLASMGREVKNIRDRYANLGIMVVNFNLGLLDDICKPIQVSGNGMLLVTDGQGSIVWHENRDWILRSVEDYGFFKRHAESAGRLTRETIDGRGFYVMRSVPDFSGWRYYALIPKNDFLQQANLLKNNLYFILLICLLFFLLGTYIIRRFITNPIMRMAVAMDRAKKGVNHPPVPIVSRDEIGTLYRSFNAMNVRIEQLIDEIKEQHEKEKVLEIMALQAQINPHFMYNTLDTINWMVKEGRAKEVSRMLISLSHIMRYSISDNSRYVTLAEELEWVKKYIFIQKNRFEKAFDFEVRADEKVLHCKTFKLILQPFVENAILHGLKDRKEGGIVEVRVAQEETDIVIEVVDNGCGIGPEQVGKLRDGIDEGVGIYNVYRRIRLAFGERYGVRLDSEIGAGTRVTVRIPTIE